MRQKSTLVLPCDPEYIAHREAQRRRRETREWLLQRERANLAPPIVPDVPNTQLLLFPAVMIPAFAVPSSILLHALSIRQLRRATPAPL